jgi:putative hydrolase of the HAD superfamily
MARRVRFVYLEPERWRLFDDTLPTLGHLQAEGWTNVVLSNHVPELREIVEYLRLGPYVARVLNSAETGYEKPHPEAFRAVLRAFDKATAVWMIGDNFKADIVGAESVGIPGILVRKVHKDARYYCTDLSLVPTTVREPKA